MKRLLTTRAGRLRLLAFLEGSSLLLLLLVAVPAKHVWGNPLPVRYCGLLHGLLFLLFAFNALSVGVEQGWRFRQTTWKVLLACFIPFGTFYIDRKILRTIPV
jgi:integral membrane protein